MKHYGHIDLNNNELQQCVLQSELNFPTVPTPGRIVFKDKRIYICAELVAGTPFWVPLTNEINTYIHVQPADATVGTWTITHNLNTTNPLVQIYDHSHNMIIPNTVTVINNNTVQVTFGAAESGRAIVMLGNQSQGVDRQVTAFEYTQVSLSSNWVIQHDLGYYPSVRIFVGNAEVQPLSIIHNDLFTTTVSFTTQCVGVARLT